jgi:RNA polymerase sigma-70 factor (ECF subfamily)
MYLQTVTHQEFIALIMPHRKSLENTAFRLTRNEIEAEDLLQETFYKSFKSFDQYQKNTNFRAWIFKIMVNTYITGYRKSVRRPKNVSLENMEDFQIYHNTSLDSESFESYNQNFDGELFEDEIKNALEKLPYYFRIVVLLSDVEEFSYQEIANMIDIPVGTVMSRLHRGRALLRNRLSKYARSKGYVPDPENMNLN